MNDRPSSRLKALKTRLALVVIGLALGFAARWIGGIVNDQEKPPHFKPMPDQSAVHEI